MGHVSGLSVFARLALSCAPGKDLAAYITAMIKCEQGWLRKYAKPRPVGDQFIRSDEDNSPAAHIEALDKLLSVLDAIIPNPEVTAPTLWHTNLDKPNIFISPTPPHHIVGIVGWRLATAGPQYLQVDFPEAMIYKGGRFELEFRSGAPPLPDGFGGLSMKEQAILKKHRWEVVAQKHHMRLITRDPRHLTGLAHPHAPLFIHSIDDAVDTWNSGIHHLNRALVGIQLNWGVLNEDGVPCPLTFTPEEITRTLEVTRRWESYDALVDPLFRELEVGVDGRLDDVEKFELMKKNGELRDKWDIVSAGGPYPFQDGGRCGSGIM